jgi:D-sedoheptulose 7-phosphate isomerase
MQDLTAYMQDTIAVLQATAGEGLESAMRAAIEAVVVALEQGHPVLIAGNGGSASDAMHIAGELVGRYKRERRGLNAIALSANPAVLTAWANDYDYETIFSRQVEAHGRAGGVFLGISTSGNSKNILAALLAAKDIGMTTIGMTGAGGGKMAGLCDIVLEAQSNDTPHIQEAHICLYHYLCDKIEARLAN